MIGAVFGAIAMASTVLKRNALSSTGSPESLEGNNFVV
jgi:hypothetical protein